MRYSELPALARVLRAYFHQDWSLDFADDDAVLNKITTVFEHQQLRGAADEIRELLDLGFGNEDLPGVLLFGAGCYFCGETTGLTPREWLTKVAECFDEAATQSI